MNNEELIERLKEIDRYNPNAGLAAAASAIRELQAERDAAIREIGPTHKRLVELEAERDALIGLIRFSLAPHVHVDMIDAMIRDALKAERESRDDAALGPKG